MIESVLHLFKIHREMIFGNPTVVIQDMLGKRPESFDAVNVVLGSPVNQGLAVAHGMMLAEPLQGIVAPESISVVYRALPRLLPDDRHQLLFGNMLHHPRIDLAIAFQKAKYNVFTLSSSAAHTLASAAKVGFIHFHLSIKLASLKFGNMIDSLAQALVEACNRLIVQVQVARKAIGRLLLIEALDNTDFGSNFYQGLLFPTALVSASDIVASRPGYFERTAKNALSSSQKVGRTTENSVSSLWHMDILTPHGYETH